MDALARAAAARPEAAAVVAGDRTYSYAELDRAASGVAAIVAGSGRCSGPAVAFRGDRTVATVAACWGIPRAGVIAVPVDPRLPPVRAMELTRSAGVRGLWTTPEGGFDRLVRRGEDAPRDLPAGGYVVFTSGSAGRSRGVVLEQHNVAASVAASRRRLGNRPDDPWLCVLPLSHVGGLAVLWRQAEAGAPVVLLERFEAESVGGALDEVAYASLVPVMLSRVLGHDERRWGRPRAVLVGGAAVADEVLASARARGLPAVATYGMTETCSQIATSLPEEPLDGTVGTALDGAEIRVVADGSAAHDRVGRIEVRGPMVSAGYVGERERATTWFTTGDLGSIDSAGRLTVAGRADRVIVTGGENVSPEAVERVVAAHPGVRAVRVFGLDDPEWGTRIAAEVEGKVTPGDLDDWVGSRLTPAERPRQWILADRVGGKLDA